MWNEGTIGIPVVDGPTSIIHFWVKNVDAPSEEYGLEGGRIIKLSMKLNGDWIANYDRGWDIDPESDVAGTALQVLMTGYN